jgi:hypothetical protein
LRASRQEWTRKLARRRQEAARPSEEQAREKSNREYEQAKAAWDVDDGRLRQLLDMAKSFTGGTAADHPGIPLQLKGGERVFLVAQDVALVEPRRGSGHWTGGYSGFSFRIAKGIRYHVGGSRGHFVQGEERPTPVDAGAVTITNRRVVFQGAKKAREWAFNKLLGYQHDSEVPLTLLSVSNRQAVSGFLYDREHAEDVHFRLALGIADCNGARDDLVHQIETEIEAHGAQKPRSPTGGPTA